MADGDVLVIGLGNVFRGDDGVGIELARRLGGAVEEAGIEVREHHGGPAELLETWRGRDTVVLIDAGRSGEQPGTLRRFDASSSPLPASFRGPSSTHAFTLPAAIELARALERLPRRVIVYAIEGRAFALGSGLSGQLEAGLERAVEVVRRALHSLSA